jgi:hypothetical protein
VRRRAERRLRDGHRAARLRQAQRRDDRPAPRQVARDRSGSVAPARLAVLQLRRPRRVDGRLPGVLRRRPVAGVQRALRHHRDGPARRRPERAVDRLQGQSGDRGHLLAAVHDARQPRSEGARRQGREVHQPVRLAEPHDPAARLDGQRRARHGPAAQVVRRGQAELLRLLLRDLPRGHVREPLPEELQPDGARRPGRRHRLHQRPARRSELAERRVRARVRPVLPGLRARPVRLSRVRRERSVGRLRPTGRQRQRDADPRRRSRSAAGRRRRHQLRRHRGDLRQAGLGRARRGAGPRRARRRDGDPPARRRVVRPARRRNLRPGQRSLLHHRRDRAALPAGRRPAVPEPRQAVLVRARAHVVEQRLRRAQLRPVADPRQGRVRRAVQDPELVADAARGGDDVRPRDALPRCQEPGPRPRQRPPDHDAR